jgi:hypothetical protein
VICALHSKYEKKLHILHIWQIVLGCIEWEVGVSDAGSELYLMEQLHEYKMVENRSVVEQAHEI